MRPRGLTVALALITSVALTGCSADQPGGPDFLATPQTAPAPSPSPTLRASPTPASTSTPTPRPSPTPTTVPPTPTATAMPTAVVLPSPAPPSPVAGEVTLTLDEQTVGRALDEKLSGQTLAQTPVGPATIRGLSVRLRNGEIEGSGTAVSGALALPLTMVATVEAREGRPVVTVRQATLGGFPLPDPARAWIERAVQDELDRLVSQARLRVTAVSIGEGTLTLRGRLA